MKRQYQISKRRAAQQFEQWAKDNPVPIQLTFPTAGIAGVKFRMWAAYLQPEAVDAKNALYKLHDELMEENPSAAGSLAEGLEETLTVTELRLTPRLRQTLSSTNAIESSFSVVGKICTQVKRWQGSDHRLRWVPSALLFAESRWNKLHGYRHMPVLVNALELPFRLRIRKAAPASAA